MDYSTMRLFMAINLSSGTREKLVALQDELRVRSKHGSFTLPENLHLTLSFLGECDLSQTAEIKAVMDATPFDPFDISINRVGYFKSNGGDTWWAGVSENKSLLDLQHNLAHKLAAVGFQPENRKYRPHITLARRVITNAEPWQIEPFGETANKIHLMKSQRAGGKLTYTSIFMRGKKLKPIVVAPYNTCWPAEFEKIKSFLLSHISDLIVDIHHVGSTSVPGLLAKPIIDLDIEIASMDIFPDIIKRLEIAGYRHKGNYGIEGREAFSHEKPGNFMDYHMYVCPSNSAELKQHLMLRDYLRANPAKADEYGALKTANAEKYVNDIDAYIDGKADFIMGCLNLAATPS